MLFFFSVFIVVIILYYFYLTTLRHVDRGFIIPGDEGEEKRKGKKHRITV